MQIVDLENIDIKSAIVKRVPEKIAKDNCLIAFSETDDYIQIAISEKNSIVYEEELRFITGKNIEFFLADKLKIEKTINKYYCKYSLDNAIKIAELEDKESISENNKTIKSEENIQGAPVVKIVSSILNEAIYQKASDIHFEPFNEEALVRFRVDGIISSFTTIPKNIFHLVCIRIKIMAQMDISERRIPLEGKIQYLYGNEDYDLRVSTLPTIYGEKIVIRILYRSKKMNCLNVLGFKDSEIKTINKMINSRYGIILITGPTGSGKTTTLYSMLNSIDRRAKNITSIEDPVEYSVENVNQVNVNAKIGFTFAEGLRSILRQDPDIIMVGEIRDEETAQIAVRAAVTGHLVISTLHTNDAAESILRLDDMGVQPYLIEESLKGVISQRLVRRICQHCIYQYKPTLNEKNALGISENDKLYKGNGCWKCNYTGYKGRTAVYEIMDINKIKKANLKEKKSAEEIRCLNKSNGIRTMKEYCFHLIKSGITTYEEFVRINLSDV